MMLSFCLVLSSTFFMCFSAELYLEFKEVHVISMLTRITDYDFCNNRVALSNTGDVFNAQRGPSLTITE